MRPVNLIPLEDRRGQKAPLRTGPLAYVIVAVLAVALLGVTLVVLTSNQISDREAEKANLQSEVDQTQAEASKLESYVNFASLQDAREQTVASLAKSRFDWERVLRELAIVIPSDVWLTNLDAKASPDVAVSGSSSSTGSSSSGAGEDILGPSLGIEGCAKGHDAVADFLGSLREIDGVTRATVTTSERQDDNATSGSGSGGVSCPEKSFIVSFDVLVAFDNAQAALAESAVPTSSSSDSASATSSSDQNQPSDAQQSEDGGTFVTGTGSSP